LNYKILIYIVLIFLCFIHPQSCQIPEPYHKPRVNLSIHVSTNNCINNSYAEYYRGDIIELVYTLNGEEFTKKGSSNKYTCYVENINGLIHVPNYITIIDKKNIRNYLDEGEHIIVFDRDVGTNKSKNISYKGKISIYASLGNHSLSQETIRKEEWTWRRKHDLTCNDNIIINIRNNIPSVSSAYIIIPKMTSLSCLPCNNTKTLIYNNLQEPIKLNFVVSAYDRDDKKLDYNWYLKDVTKNNETFLFNTSYPNFSHLLTIPNLTSGRKFSFSVIANDRSDNSIPFNATFIHEKEFYDTIYIPSTHPTVPIILYIFIIFFLIIFGVKEKYFYIIYNTIKKRLHIEETPFVDEIVLFIILLFITSTYIYINKYGYWLLYKFYESDELMVYLKSLNLFEIYIYLIVFVVIVYFTEVCFGWEEPPKLMNNGTTFLESLIKSFNLITITSKLWIINSVLMLIVLLSFDSIVLRANSIDTQNWLINYYGEIGEIFATILAIIAAFYTAIPKNVVSIKRMRYGEKKKTYSYLHTKILQYFLVLYSVIVVLSIWGFSVGIIADFPPMVDLNKTNFFNLISIGVFETTLLLVPPAISCLYELLRSMLFTGSIKLNSTPKGARIFVDERDTRLQTPNVLMLPKGPHRISIEKDGYLKYDVKGEGENGAVCVRAGTEQEYECKLKGIGILPPK